MKKNLLFFAAGLLLLAGCSKETKLDVTAETFALNAASSEQTFQITGNSSWSITTDGATWYTVSPTSGSGDATITITVDPNASSSDRSSVITITSGDKIETITITQAAASAPSTAGDIVIKEIFFAGCALDDGGSDGPDGDQYVILANASDDVKKLDGLIFALSDQHSQTSSSGAVWVYPTLTDSIAVATIYAIPNGGYFLEPGGTITIAFAAQNFKSENGVGCDLSTADFEIYDENDYVDDTDNPDVPNLDSWFKSSFSISSLHNRGYFSLAIAMPEEGMTAEKFMEDYVWTGKRTMDWNGYSFNQDIDGEYLIPNAWVLDGVNCAVKEDLGTLWFNSTIDAGYTNVTDKDSDDARFGKSVSRKMVDGLYVDTNNSTSDFEILTSASLK